MKIKTLVMVDSFKGSMSSFEAVSIIAENLDKSIFEPDIMVISDGGEGFLDALRNDRRSDKAKTVDALGRENVSEYLISEDNKTLYFELAESVGIKDLKPVELDVQRASTYGLGLAVKEGILKHRPERVVLGVGGSASNDGGTGMLEAMGVKFFGKEGVIEQMCAEKLALVESFDTTELDKLIKDIKFSVLTDVKNPLLGKDGATYVYARQKGGNDETLPVLEENMKKYGLVASRHFGKDMTNAEGAGAAGGVGYGMLAFANASLSSGIDFVLSENGFDKEVKNYDLVITGEGRLDSQSLCGKVISGIIERNPKKLALVVGSNALDDCQYPVFPIVPLVATLEESMSDPKASLARLIKEKFNKYPF